ncbi:MAG: hypothetical protein PHT49_10020 [Desulfovibrionales bacterium]|nr:hypothetical protein [Desulfovibrionales bacterium]
MERFRNYVGKTVVLEKVREAVAQNAYGLAGRYLPDPPEDFDEFEFITDWDGENKLALMVTVEMMKVKRIFFGISSPENPDVVRGLSDTELKELLEKKGGVFVSFFDHITRG